MSDDGQRLREYRRFLIEAEKEAQGSWDRTLLTLAAGAIGISVVFLRDLAGPGTVEKPWALISAWVFWTLTLICVLISFFTSRNALRHAISETDAALKEKLDNSPDQPGGRWTRATEWLNRIGVPLFIAGIILLFIFAAANLEVSDGPETRDNASAHR